jgi:hypothetical protein
VLSEKVAHRGLVSRERKVTNVDLAHLNRYSLTVNPAGTPWGQPFGLGEQGIRAARLISPGQGTGRTQARGNGATWIRNSST